MTKPATLHDIAQHISADLPGEPVAAAQTALTVAAAKCIDAGVSDEEAVRGFRAALKNLRSRLGRRRAH